MQVTEKEYIDDPTGRQMVMKKEMTGCRKWWGAD